MLSKAFNDPALLDRFIESWDDNIRQPGKSVEEYLSQPNLFGNELSPEAEKLLRFFDKNPEAAALQKPASSSLRGYDLPQEAEKIS